MNNLPNGKIEPPSFSNFISVASQHIQEIESAILKNLDDPNEDELEFMDTDDVIELGDVALVEEEPGKCEENGNEESPDDPKSPKEELFERDSSDDHESVLSEDTDEETGEPEDAVVSLKKQGDEKLIKGLWEDAIESYTKALTCRQLAALYGNRSLCYMKLGEYEKAERDCCSAIELDPFYKRIFRRRAAIRLRRKDYYGSAQDLQSLRILSFNAKLDPNVIEEYQALLPLARLVKMEGLSSRVQELEKSVLSKLCQIEESAAESFKQRSMWPQVVESLSMAIVVSPAVSRLYYERAFANFKLGKANLAETDCSEAIGLDPSNHKYYRLRADVRKKLGKTLDSQLDEETARKLCPSSDAEYLLEQPAWQPSQPAPRPAPAVPQPPDEPSNLVRIPVRDVYTSDSYELFDLSKLPDAIRACIFS